jgi:hypothetical protein
MGFLIKSAFWLSLVLLVIPIGGGDGDSTPRVGAIEAFLAAQAVVGDVAGMCERKPEACEVGKSALQTIGVRAKESARIAYGMLDEHVDDAGEQPVHTGSIAAAPAKESVTVATVPVPSARASALTE